MVAKEQELHSRMLKFGMHYVFMACAGGPF